MIKDVSGILFSVLLERNTKSSFMKFKHTNQAWEINYFINYGNNNDKNTKECWN